MKARKIVVILWCLALLPGLSIIPAQAAKPLAATDKVGVAGELNSIRISFRLKEITRESFYMGDVWVSPPTFNGAQAGKEFTVQVRATGLTAQNRQVPVNPVWIPEDPAMVMAVPSQGPETTLTVSREGESLVTVKSGKISQKLKIKANYRDKIMSVTITQ